MPWPVFSARERFKLDLRDSTTLKGIAILAIAFHNYFHLLSPARENEFNFDPRRVFSLIAAVQDPRYCVQGLFSFFGHLGVQVFIFLSAYGLATRYWDNRTGWVPFVWGRACKIYPMFLVSIGLWAVILGLPNGLAGPLELTRANSGSLVLTVLGVSNLVPGHGIPPVGPWWFIPFIIQLYCLWPLLRACASRFGPKGLAVLSAGSLFLVITTNGFLIDHWSLDLLLSPIGCLPVICLGIAAARFGYFPNRAGVAVAACIFLASNFFGPVFPLGFPCATVVMIWMYVQLRAILPGLALWHRAGLSSMALFLVNGFARDPFFEMASSVRNWGLELFLGFAAVAYAYAMAELLTRSLTCFRFRIRTRDGSPATIHVGPPGTPAQTAAVKSWN